MPEREILIQYPEFDELSQSIEETSSPVVSEREYSGSLVGADTKTRRFHFVTDDDKDMRGGFTDVISYAQKAELPARYVALIRTISTMSLATAKEDEKYELLRLSPDNRII